MDIAEKIVKKIEVDICDRGGIGNEWESIDNITKKEIRLEWAKIIREEINKKE